MEERLHVTSIDNLGRIHDAIHDCEFDLDDVSYDEKSQKLAIRFSYEDLEGSGLMPKISFRKRIPVYEAMLIINNVYKYIINDTEKVGTYSFNILVYDAKSQSITITTDVLLEFKVYVRNFDVSVEVTDKLIGEKRSWLWGLSELLKGGVNRR